MQAQQALLLGMHQLCTHQGWGSGGGGKDQGDPPGFCHPTSCEMCIRSHTATFSFSRKLSCACLSIIEVLYRFDEI